MDQVIGLQQHHLLGDVSSVDLGLCSETMGFVPFLVFLPWNISQFLQGKLSSSKSVSSFLHE